MKIKRKWIVTGILATPVVAAVVSFPIFACARENARKSSCQNNMKQMALVMAQYAQDFDDRLQTIAVDSEAHLKALIAKGSKANPAFGWCDALLPYSKSICVLQCPAEASEVIDKAWEKGYTDYWMNAKVEKRKLGSLKGAHVIINCDGAGWDGGTARYAMGALPNSLAPVVVQEFTQPAWPLRHLGGANYAIADGHVKWLTPDQDSTAPGLNYTLVP